MQWCMRVDAFMVGITSPSRCSSGSTNCPIVRVSSAASRAPQASTGHIVRSCGQKKLAKCRARSPRRPDSTNAVAASS